MREIKNKKGFTLIELLAVIVVLAIVMVLATTTVLPLMNNAKKNSFALEATEVINTASNLITVMPLGTVDNLEKYTAGGADVKADYASKSETGVKKYCFSLKMLADIGFLKKDISYFDGDTAEYAGRVIVTASDNSNTYLYDIAMHNADWEVISKEKLSSFKGKDVKSFNSADAKWDCTDAFTA